jgi:hypothetical protein
VVPTFAATSQSFQVIGAPLSNNALAGHAYQTASTLDLSVADKAELARQMQSKV